MDAWIQKLKAGYDAGYYDNFGINLDRQHSGYQIRDNLLRKNTFGLYLNSFAWNAEATACLRRSRTSWMSPSIRPSNRSWGSATWSRSTRPCILRPSTSSTTP